MKSKKIFLCFTLALLSFSAYAGGNFPSLLSSEVAEDNVKTLYILINERTSKVEMKDVPKTGYLEVYSILGVKVKSINLASIDAEYELTLPKGIYILKAGKVAQKVIIR